MRTVSVKGPGRHDHYPGERLLDLGLPPDPSRFMQGPVSAPQESEIMTVDPKDLILGGARVALI